MTVTASKFSQRDNVIDLRHISMPVTVIDKKMIDAMGSCRLDEVLREQTGMAIVSDLGAGNRATGLQMQGFSAEYITILINGQPMTGRNSGSFDLSRISVSDIERIEIIKGASSSLYGSEALGGVVNIITRQQVSALGFMSELSYGSNNIFDATVGGETPFASKKGAVHFSGNYYRTDGFNVNPFLKDGSQTSPPYNSIAVQGRGQYRLNGDHAVFVTGRMATRRSVMTRSYGATPFEDVLNEQDANAMVSWNHQQGSGVRFTGRYYVTSYGSRQEVSYVESGHSLQEDRFTETIHRVEAQAAGNSWKNSFSWIGGAGAEYISTRATGGGMYNYFGYLQAVSSLFSLLQITTGLRYDGNNIYGGKINPSIGVSYTPVAWITFKGAVGRGFKSPTYRQLHQMFTNLSQGYTVVGANAFSEAVKTLQASGQVQQVWPVANGITALKPETATSLNMGLELRPFSRLKVTINGFYNSIRNLITNQQVGIKTNGAQLFSWFNISKLYTTGLEAGIQYQPVHGLHISAGYQLLFAIDPSVRDSIKAASGAYASVRAPNAIRRSVPADYFGLPNRSRHMANMQVGYEYTPWKLSLSVRGVYRSKFGFMDQDNNGFIDRYDVFVNGYVLLYGSLQKRLLHDRLTLRVSIDNVNDYTDMLMPAQPGRVVMGGLSWNWQRKKQERVGGKSI